MVGSTVRGKERLYVLSGLVFLTIWSAVSLFSRPIFLPSPRATAEAALVLLRSGELLWSMAVSLFRILAGWALGGATGILLGLVMGRVRWMQALAAPVLEFFRFVPPITFVTLFIIWFGAGEASKVILIFYNSVFIQILNTMAGVAAVREGAVRAARSLGASGVQVFFRVVVPETVPYMVTGLRLALSNAFMTIVAAEMLAAKSGVGHLIWSAQNFSQTDQIFVGFAALCLMGACSDQLFHVLALRMLSHYRVV